MVFLQTSLLYYQQQILAVRGALLGQSLLAECPSSLAKTTGQVEDFTYSIDHVETPGLSGAWFHLTLWQGKRLILKQSLWRPDEDRLVVYQSFSSGEWREREVDGPADTPAPDAGNLVGADGLSITYRGATVFRSQQALQFAQLSPSGSQIAVLQGSEVWVINLANSFKASSWYAANQQLTSLDWTDDQSLVACEGDNKLVKLTRTGHELLYEGTDLNFPAVSPDGRFIAYISSLDGNNDLLVLDLRSKTSKNITHSPEGEIRPQWSRRGQRILFGIAPTAGGVQLGCINPDGSGRQDLETEASSNNWRWK